MIHVVFDDGTEGDADLSDIAKQPVTMSWELGDNFRKVYLDSETGAITWNDQLDIDPDRIYFDLKGIDPQTFYSRKASHAND